MTDDILIGSFEHEEGDEPWWVWQFRFKSDCVDGGSHTLTRYIGHAPHCGVCNQTAEVQG